MSKRRSLKDHAEYLNYHHISGEKNVDLDRKYSQIRAQGPVKVHFRHVGDTSSGWTFLYANGNFFILDRSKHTR